MTKRYLLKLSYSPDFVEPSEVGNKYFSKLIYDRISMGCWFLDKQSALLERHRLKMENPNALYDIIFSEDAWSEAENARKEMVFNLSKNISQEDSPALLESIDDDFIKGDNDTDPVQLLEELSPTPLATGKFAITIANMGAGELYFCKEGIKIPVTKEEAKAIATVNPSAIHLYAKKGEAE